MQQAGASLHLSARPSHCLDFSRAGVQASVVRVMSSVGKVHGLSSCGTGPYLLRGVWDLPEPGIEPMSPALTGGLLTTGPPGKFLPLYFDIILFVCFVY